MCSAPKPLIWCTSNHFYIKRLWNGLRFAILTGWLYFLKISQKFYQKISTTNVKNSKADMLIFVSPLPVIMAYFVLPKSSCIEWEIGNLDTFMFLEISQYSWIWVSHYMLWLQAGVKQKGTYLLLNFSRLLQRFFDNIFERFSKNQSHRASNA